MTSIENNIQKISSLIGAENVIQDEESLHFYSTDILDPLKNRQLQWFDLELQMNLYHS